MNFPISRKYIRLITKCASLVILASTIQYFVGLSSNFVGQEISTIGAGVVKEYFSVVAFEFLKILGFITACLFPIYLLASSSLKRIRGKVARPGLTITLGLLLSYFFGFLGSAIKYPALYQASLPNWTHTLIFKLSFIVSPTSLNTCCGIFLLGALFYGVSLSRNSNGTKKGGGKTSWSIPRFGTAIGLTLIAGYIGNQSTRFELWPRETKITTQKRPNILLIGIDSFRYDKAQNSAITPNIAKLISEPGSTFFKDHHVGIPRTFPSWVEMIQGNYASKTGIRHMFPPLKKSRMKSSSIISYLNDAGYKTGVCSDFAGDIFPRYNFGFQETNAPDMNLDTLIKQNVDLLFPLFLPFVLSDVGHLFFPDLKGHPAFANPDHLTSLAQNFIASSKEKPFFLTLFYSTAHFPYAAPWPYYSKFSSPNYPGPFYFQKNPELASTINSTKIVDIKQIRNLYDGAMNSIDNSLGNLFGYLKKQGSWDNTIIVVTADHGEDLFENQNFQGHGEHLLGTQVLNVPLIIKQNAASAGKSSVVSSLSRSIDIAPTLLDMVNVAQTTMGGVSLKPLFSNESVVPPIETSYSESGIWFSNKGTSHFQKNRLYYPGISQLLSFDPGNTAKIVLNQKFESVIQTAKHRSLIFKNFKIIYIPKKTGIIYQLYDRKKDRENTNDIAKQQPEILNEMKQMLHDKIRQLEPYSKFVDGYVVPR